MNLVRSVYGSMIEFKAEVMTNIKLLREDLNSLNNSVSNLSVCLQEHKEQTTAELAHLQTSFDSTQSYLENISSKLDSTHSKLDSLTATTAQLSFDHQQIQANISDVECLDTEQSLELHQNLQDNLTHQLEKIEDDVSFVREQYWCGGTGGWIRVVYLDMTNPSTTCPSDWQLTGYSKRTCGRNSTDIYTCDSATFPLSGGQYYRVCGRIKAYQWGGTTAFAGYHNAYTTNTDGEHVDGVSVTHGTPRNHIWTFVAGISESNPTEITVCPCDASIDISIPPFVGEDYFCEAGINEPWDLSRHYIFHSNDTLWDGEDCLPSSTCCSQHNPPYFIKQLPTSTTDDIEATICVLLDLSHSNIAVELVELYVQ